MFSMNRLLVRGFLSDRHLAFMISSFGAAVESGSRGAASTTRKFSLPGTGQVVVVCGWFRKPCRRPHAQAIPGRPLTLCGGRYCRGRGTPGAPMSSPLSKI